MYRIYGLIFCVGAFLGGLQPIAASECTDSEEVQAKAAEVSELIQNRSHNEEGIANLEKASRLLSESLMGVGLDCVGRGVEIDKTDMLRVGEWWLNYFQVNETLLLFNESSINVLEEDKQEQLILQPQIMARTIEAILEDPEDIGSFIREFELTDEDIDTAERMRSMALYHAAHFLVEYVDNPSDESRSIEDKPFGGASLQDILSELKNSRYPDVYHRGYLRLATMLGMEKTIEDSDNVSSFIESATELFTSTGGNSVSRNSAHELNNMLYMMSIMFDLEDLPGRHRRRRVARSLHASSGKVNEIYSYFLHRPLLVKSTPKRVPEIRFMQLNLSGEFMF